MTKDKTTADAVAIAQFKFALIAPVLQGWLYTLDISSITSLAEFNRLLKDYMRSYNTTPHTGTGTTPLERYQDSREHIRIPKSSEWLQECFLNRITRKVNKDATVSINKVSFEFLPVFRFQGNDTPAGLLKRCPGHWCFYRQARHGKILLPPLFR